MPLYYTNLACCSSRALKVVGMVADVLCLCTIQILLLFFCSIKGCGYGSRCVVPLYYTNLACCSSRALKVMGMVADVVYTMLCNDFCRNVYASFLCKLACAFTILM